MGLIVRLEKAKSKRLGSKVRMLRFLSRHGFHIPTTHVCVPEAYRRYLESQDKVIGKLREELARLVDADQQYAIRSSASVEDHSKFSFAGQFKSVLHVQGVEKILQAIRSIWETTHSDNVQVCLKQHGMDLADYQMSVIIQEMVSPQVSGVAFSKNPVTGLDEVVVEAVRGSGEALVQGGVTPFRWVNKWGRWTKSPAPVDEIPFELIEKVVTGTKLIAGKFGRPVDLEWVYDGRSLYWVQLREITTLDSNVYSNRISAEFFPGLIKPLIWSVNVPLVNGAWIRLFTELIGSHTIKPDDLAKSFYYRAYFNMGTVGRIFAMLGFPSESLELMMGIEQGGTERPKFKPSARTLTYLPRMLLFALKKLNFGRRIERFAPVARERYRTFVPDRGASLSQLVGEIDRLYPLVQKTAYFNIVTPLLLQLYTAMLKGQLARFGIPFESIDLAEGMIELEQYDPSVHLARLAGQFMELDDETRERIKQGTYAEFSAMPGIGSLRRNVEEFIARFGHLSDSGNDFSAVPWRETPDLVLEMVVHFQKADRPDGTRVRRDQLAIPRLSRPLVNLLFRGTRRYLFYREWIGTLYTFGYGLFRNYFLVMGNRLAARRWIESERDIFYLYLDELREIKRQIQDGDLMDKIAERKAAMERCAALNPPTVIYGDEDIRPISEPVDLLEGTPTSRGTYTGPARVLMGLGDFSRLEQGDVLVIPYSDVGWTPLFAMAGAIVAESGGRLSHSSIVAREYGIPAVVSVPNACQLEDGTIVTVDGYKGLVTIEASDRS